MNSAAFLLTSSETVQWKCDTFSVMLIKRKKRKCEFHLYITIEVLLCAIHIICTLAHVYKILKEINISGVHTQTFLLMPVCREILRRTPKYWIRELNHHMQYKILQQRGCRLSVNQIRSVPDPTKICDSKKFTPFSSNPHLCCEPYKLLKVQLFPASLGHGGGEKK